MEKKLRFILPKFTVALVFVSLGWGTVEQSPALANVIELTTDAQYLQNGVLIDDNPMLAPGGSITSLVTTSNGLSVDFSGDALATAVNSNGITAVQSNGIFAFPKGSNPMDELKAKATFLEEFTNNSGIAQSYTYDFFVPPPRLRIDDYVFGPDATSIYNMEINLLTNGTSTTLWNSSATLVGGQQGFTLTESGTDLGGTFFCLTSGCTQSNPGNSFGFDFDPFADVLSLGTFADGESFTLEVIVETIVSAPPFELGGFATIGDPGNVSGQGFGGTITSQPSVSPTTPEPTSMFSLMALGGLLLANARKQKEKQQ